MPKEFENTYFFDKLWNILWENHTFFKVFKHLGFNMIGKQMNIIQLMYENNYDKDKIQNYRKKENTNLIYDIHLKSKWTQRSSSSLDFFDFFPLDFSSTFGAFLAAFLGYSFLTGAFFAGAFLATFLGYSFLAAFFPFFGFYSSYSYSSSSSSSSPYSNQ